MPRTGDTFAFDAGDINNWAGPLASEGLDIAGWNALRTDIEAGLTASLARTGGTMLGPFLAVAGAIGAPGVSWVLEPTSGFYRVSTGVFRFATGGVDRFQVGTSGVMSKSASGLREVITAQGCIMCSIPNATVLPASFTALGNLTNVAESDANSILSISGATVVIGEAGYYRVTATIPIVAAGATSMIQIQVNGSGQSSTSRSFAPGGAGVYTALTVDYIANFSLNDTVAVAGNSTSAASSIGANGVSALGHLIVQRMSAV